MLTLVKLIRLSRLAAIAALVFVITGCASGDSDLTDGDATGSRPSGNTESSIVASSDATSSVAESSLEANSESSSSVASKSSPAVSVSSSAQLPVTSSETASSASVSSVISQPTSEVSSSAASEMSSVVASSSQSSAPVVDHEALSLAAIAIIEDQCTSCHIGTHNSWQPHNSNEAWLNAQSKTGERYVNPLQPRTSLLLRRIRGYGASDSNMPFGNTDSSEEFTSEHYETVAAWIDSFAIRPPEIIGDDTLAIDSITFDEAGVHLELSCSEDITTGLTLNLANPDILEANTLDAYTGLAVRPSGASVIDVDSIASMGLADEFTLIGQGIDIWQDNIYFNALTKPIENGNLDITLDVYAASGIEDDFAKVGLLVSSTDDLSGELVFLHWSGRYGIAEDGGEGVLDSYRLVLANPNPGEAITPTPTRLRVAYEGNSLKVGGCYDCAEPPMGLANIPGFEPKRVYVVASSHTEDTISATISLVDAYDDATDYRQIDSSNITCENGKGEHHIAIPDASRLDRLNIELVRNDELVAASVIPKTFTEAASCAVQNSLLEPKLRRLSELQIRYAVTDIFGDIFDEDVWPGLEDGAKLIGMNTTADKLQINNLNLERIYAASRSISQQIIADHGPASTCAAADSPECVDAIATNSGQLIWRRPLSSQDLADLAEGYSALASNAEKLDFLYRALLLSPNFLFRNELGQFDGEVYNLDNYEVISTLSFSLWNSGPDSHLLDLAAQSTLLTQEQLLAEVDRMFDDPKTNRALVELYKDYLKVDLVLTRPKEESLEFNESVRQSLLASIEKTIESKLESAPHFLDVFLGNQFYINDSIADIFGVNAASSELTSVSVDAAQREGLLNHPAFLSVHSTLAKSGIVKRGVFALEQLLCQELPEPPADVMPQPVSDGIDADATSDRDLLLLTHSAEASCYGCHQVIDPAGFGFENFDTIGRYREYEKGDIPIDASGLLDNVGSHTLMYDNSAEYARELVASPQMRQCVSQRFLESFIGQDLAHDDCEVKKYQALLQDSDSTTKDLFRSLIGLESLFKRQ